MFTGLVQEIGRVDSVAARASVTVLGLSAPQTAATLAVGDSLAVNGICLTVTRLAGRRVEVEATEETRRVTTLRRWKAGDSVHLEPSLRVGDPIGGHFVLGHVDGVGRLAGLERRGAAAIMRVQLDEGLAAHLLPKGSIAVDGVSLTLGEGPFHDTFSIMLVPHTLSATRFGAIRPGDEVNIELDVLAKAARSAAAAATGTSPPAPVAPPLTLASLLGRGWQKGARRKERS